MKLDLPLAPSTASNTNASTIGGANTNTDAIIGFHKVILRLVKGGAEREAIDAGQIDAIMDSASGKAILLPEAQQAVVANHFGLRSWIGLAFDWYWEQDENFRFVSRVGATAQSAGFTDAELLGKSLWELPIDNMSADDWRTHRQQLAWQAAFRDLEVRRIDRSGEPRYLTLSGEPIFDERRQFKGYRGIAREITERRQMQDLLLQEPQRLARATLDALAAPVALLDRAGTVLTTNRAWRAFAATGAGGRAGVCEGANYLASCDDAPGEERIDALAMAAGIRQVLGGERALFRYDHAYDGPAGRYWFAHCVTAAANNDAARAVLTLEDITERKRAESLLALEYTVARLLANSASESAAVGGVIRAVCQNRGWDCGRYFRRDPLTGMLCCSDSWGQATPAVEQFLEKSRGLVLRPDVGLTGRVFGSGQPLWVRDGSQDPSLALAALAPETGREGAFVFAVTNEDQTIGVLAFSGTNVHEPDHRKLQAVHSIGSQLGRFLHQQAALDILRRTATRSRKLAELGSDWTWELDRNLRLTQLVGSNPFGTIPVLGRAFWQLPGVVPSDAQWAEHKSQLAARWSFCDFEFAVVRPDGELGHFCLCGEPLFDDAGTFTGYCGTARDITHRKRTQLASRHGPDNTLAL